MQKWARMLVETGKAQIAEVCVMSPMHQVLPKPSCNAQWKGEEGKADRGRGGKTTSENGQAWCLPSPRGQWRTGKNGGKWLQNHLWCPNDPHGYRVDDDDDEFSTLSLQQRLSSYGSPLFWKICRIRLHRVYRLKRVNNNIYSIFGLSSSQFGFIIISLCVSSWASNGLVSWFFFCLLTTQAQKGNYFRIYCWFPSKTGIWPWILFNLLQNNTTKFTVNVHILSVLCHLCPRFINNGVKRQVKFLTIYYMHSTPCHLWLT